MKCTVDSLLTDSSIRWTPRVGPCLSLLTLYLTLCKTDTSVKQTPRVGPCLSLLTLNYLTLYKMDTSLRWAVSACWSQSWFWRELSINAEFKVMISCSSCQLVQCMCVNVYASWKHMVILLTKAKLFQTFFLYTLSLFFQDFDKLTWHA